MSLSILREHFQVSFHNGYNFVSQINHELIHQFDLLRGFDKSPFSNLPVLMGLRPVQRLIDTTSSLVAGAVW